MCAIFVKACCNAPTPDVHPSFIAILPTSPFSLSLSGMDSTDRRKSQFPRCGSNLKSTQKRPSDRAKKCSWLREIDVLDYLATQSGIKRTENALYIQDGIKTRQQMFLRFYAIFVSSFHLHYKIIHLPWDIRKSCLICSGAKRNYSCYAISVLLKYNV